MKNPAPLSAPLELRLVDIESAPDTTASTTSIAQELSLVDQDPVPDDVASTASTEPISLESVTLQPFSDRRPKPDRPTSPAAPPGTPTSAPLDGSIPASGPAIDLVDDLGPITASPASGAGRFLAEATREYETGRIDQPLWMRAAAQSGGNENVARDAYLRARATALKLARREQRGNAASPGTDAAGRANVARVGANLAGRAIRGNDDAPDQKRKYMAMAAGVAMLVVAAGGWFALGGSSPAPAVAATAPVSAVTAAKARSPGAMAPQVATPEDHAQYFGTKVQELKSAGNWNVLVLYASEWTRKQPESATAWKELSIGYSNMRQFDDALHAGTKAAQLAPQDPASWRNLGQINVSLDQPAAALEAFERATALDDRDLPTFVRAGHLNVQLDRLTEARTAFDKVLAVSPDHVGALCGRAQLAQKLKQAKEADALARHLKAVDGRCRDGGEVGAVTVATGTPATPGATGSAAYKPVTTRGR